MSPRVSRAVATTVALLTTALAVGSVALYFANTAKAQLPPLGFNAVASLILVVTLPSIGWLIASRRRENRVGWMLLAIGFFYALTQFSAAYAAYGLVAVPGSLPLADVMSWITILGWVPGLNLLILLLLFFPDGRLPSRRWRPVVWIAGGALVVMLVPDAIAFWPYRGLRLLATDVSTPASDPAPAIAGLLLGVGLVLALVVAAAGAGALVIRFRRRSRRNISRSSGSRARPSSRSPRSSSRLGSCSRRRSTALPPSSSRLSSRSPSVSRSFATASTTSTGSSAGR